VADGLVHEGRGTFQDAATRWLNSKVRIRPSTRRSYEHLLVCYLIPYFGDRKLRLIQVTDVERFRAELSQGIPDSIRQACITRLLKAKPGLAEARAKQRANQVRLGRRSINKALTVLSMVFNYAVRNQWMMRNPAEYVDHARDDRPIEQRPLDMDEREFADQLSSYAAEGAEYARDIERVRRARKINNLSRDCPFRLAISAKHAMAFGAERFTRRAHLM
jgi:hypothetical protein